MLSPSHDQGARRGDVSMWGKIIGGVAGFMTGGPIGAMMGAALGHAADAERSPAAALGGRGPLPSNAADLAALLGSKETLFAIGVVVLSAKLAKVDGAVSRAEIDAFKRHFRIPPENLREVGRLFDRARDEPGNYAPFADRLGRAFADNKAMLEDVLAALFEIARADGAINRAELAFLQQVHARLGLDEGAWGRANTGATRRPEEAGDPYAVLGLDAGASNEAIRAAWRQLMRDNHPDGLAARGVPPEFVNRATAKVAEINAAWDRIKRARGL